MRKMRGGPCERAQEHTHPRRQLREHVCQAPVWGSVHSVRNRARGSLQGGSGPAVCNARP